MYDMLKPIDKGITIENIQLLEKSGGKSDFNKKKKDTYTASVIVCSDSIAAGKKEDRAGKAIVEKLENFGVTIDDYTVIPDDVEQIQEIVNNQHSKEIDLLIFTGGTGLSPRDQTPEALLPLLERNIPGIEEAIRQYGQQRTPYAMLSRSVVGTIGSMIVLGLPGSTKGASESMDAIFPEVLHVFKVLKGKRHDK